MYVLATGPGHCVREPTHQVTQSVNGKDITAVS